MDVFYFEWLADSVQSLRQRYTARTENEMTLFLASSFYQTSRLSVVSYEIVIATVPTDILAAYIYRRFNFYSTYLQPHMPECKAPRRQNAHTHTHL